MTPHSMSLTPPPHLYSTTKVPSSFKSRRPPGGYGQWTRLFPAHCGLPPSSSLVSITHSSRSSTYILLHYLTVALTVRDCFRTDERTDATFKIIVLVQWFCNTPRRHRLQETQNQQSSLTEGASAIKNRGPSLHYRISNSCFAAAAWEATQYIIYTLLYNNSNSNGSNGTP